jgi:hypothetical protein
MYRLIVLILFINILVYSQDSDNRYIAVEGGIGYSRFLSTLSLSGLNKNGISASLAAYWHPEHLLEAGIETGYSYLYSYKNNESTEFGNSGASASLVSVPATLVFRMSVIGNLRIQAGSGIIFLFNQGEAFGDNFSSRTISIIDYIGFTYFYNLTNNILLGGSFRYTYIFKGEESYIAIQVNAAYKFLEW